MHMTVFVFIHSYIYMGIVVHTYNSSNGRQRKADSLSYGPAGLHREFHTNEVHIVSSETLSQGSKQTKES